MALSVPPVQPVSTSAADTDKSGNINLQFSFMVLKVRVFINRNLSYEPHKFKRMRYFAAITAVKEVIYEWSTGTGKMP